MRTARFSPPFYFFETVLYLYLVRRQEPELELQRLVEQRDGSEPLKVKSAARILLSRAFGGLLFSGLNLL